MVKTVEITISFNRGHHLITDLIEKELKGLGENGILQIFVKHTSAGITVNETSDPSVRDDFESFFNRLIPENAPYFTHTDEGSDDMPAHLKASIIGQSVTVPVTNGKLNMGIWQGIYFCEFRNRAGARRLQLTFIGE